METKRNEYEESDYETFFSVLEENSNKENEITIPGYMRRSYYSRINLSIFFCRALTQFAKLNKLIHITSLAIDNSDIDDNWTQILAELSEGGHLRNLQSISCFESNIDDNAIRYLLQAIKKGLFPRLSDLTLSRTNISNKSLHEIIKLIHDMNLCELKELDISGTPLDDNDLDLLSMSLEKHSAPYLTGLYIYDTNISDNGLIALAHAADRGGLSNLESLLLSRTNVGDAGLTAFANAAARGNLPRLQLLGASNTSVGDEGIKAIAAAAEQGGFQALQVLELENSQISDAGLIALARAASKNHFNELKELLIDSSNTRLVDNHIINSNSARQILDAALRGVPTSAGRIIVVGSGNVGKTWLFRRCFLNEIVNYHECRNSTHDIDLIRSETLNWLPVVRVGDQFREVELRVWDFAGQLVAHGVHEGFLDDDGRTVYLLVLSANRFPTSVIDANGEESGNAIAYWLKTIRHFGGANAPVVIAITQCDRTDQNRQVDEPLDQVGKPLKNTSPELLFETFDSCVTAIVDNLSACNRRFSITHLRDEIESAFRQVPGLMSRKVPPELIALKIMVEKELQKCTLVHVQVFRKWCHDCNIDKIDDQELFLRMLHHMGCFFYFGRTKFEEESLLGKKRPEFDSFAPGRERLMRKLPGPILQSFVANSSWLKKAIYTLTRSSERKAWIGLGEVEGEAHASEEGHQSHPNAVAFVDAFLRHMDLSYFDENRQQYLFPRGLKRGLPDGTKDWAKATLTWDYLPEAAFHRFVVAMHNRGYVVRGERGEFRHWRDSVLIEYVGAQAAVIVEVGEGLIEVRIDPNCNVNVRQKVYEMIRELFVAEIVRNSPTRELVDALKVDCTEMQIDRQRQSTTAFFDQVRARKRLTSGKGRLMHLKITPTFGIITALPKEFVAVEVLLQNAKDHQTPGSGAGRRYKLGMVPASGGDHHHVVLALLPDMANNMASIAATLMMERFPSVETIIMTGIAGGAPNPAKPGAHVRLGDIVVSNRNGVVQYDNLKCERIDKLVEDKLRAAPRPPSAKMLEGVNFLNVEAYKGNRPWLTLIDEVINRLNFNRPTDDSDILHHSTDCNLIVPHPFDDKRVLGCPRIFQGTIASANILLKDPIRRDMLRDKFGVMAIEMEGSGVSDATWHQENGYIVVRGICDYCDMSKGDAWQEYAAATAAGYTIALIASLPRLPVGALGTVAPSQFASTNG